jgi:hypothetical protein
MARCMPREDSRREWSFMCTRYAGGVGGRLAHLHEAQSTGSQKGGVTRKQTEWRFLATSPVVNSQPEVWNSTSVVTNLLAGSSQTVHGRKTPRAA